MAAFSHSIAVVFALMAASVALPAMAAGAGSVSQICDGSVTASHAERIAACTQLIEMRGLNQRDLSLAHLHRSWPLSLAGKLEAAIADLNVAVKLDPLSAYIRSDRGFANLRAKKLDLAIADYDAAIKLDPRAVYALYGRGIAHLRKGHKPKGEADLDAARVLQTNVDDVFAALGVRP